MGRGHYGGERGWGWWNETMKVCRLVGGGCLLKGVGGGVVGSLLILFSSVGTGYEAGIEYTGKSL